MHEDEHRLSLVAAVKSMRCGYQRREVKVVGHVMPLATPYGAMPRGQDGGEMLLWEGDCVMPFQGDCGAIPSRRLTVTRGCHEDWCDVGHKWHDAI